MADRPVQEPVLDPVFPQRLADLLKKRSGRHITGAQLAPLIATALGQDHTFRDFLPQGEPARLRTFVERFVPSNLLLPTDLRKGSDYFFDIVGSNEPATAALSQRGRLWRSFVSINPQSKLVFDRTTVTVKALPSEIEPPADCVEIAPVALHEHAEICRAFVAKLRDDERVVPGLDKVLIDFDQTSYPRWLKALRAVPPLDRHWGEFRHQALLSLFCERLKGVGVREERVPELRAELARDYDAARLPAQAVVPIDIAASALRVGDDREKRARELLRLAAEKLPLEQLQAIQLPLGVILELLGNQG